MKAQDTTKHRDRTHKYLYLMQWRKTDDVNHALPPNSRTFKDLTVRKKRDNMRFYHRRKFLVKMPILISLSDNVSYKSCEYKKGSFSTLRTFASQLLCS